MTLQTACGDDQIMQTNTISMAVKQSKAGTAWRRTRTWRSMFSTVMSFSGLPATGFCPCEIALMMEMDCSNEIISDENK